MLLADFFAAVLVLGFALGVDFTVLGGVLRLPRTIFVLGVDGLTRSIGFDAAAKRLNSSVLKMFEIMFGIVFSLAGFFKAALRGAFALAVMYRPFAVMLWDNYSGSFMTE